MDNDTSERPGCFGVLDKVFPMSDRGLRETPDDCMYQCPCKTECLRAAMAGIKGITVQEELIERGEQAGMLNFFQRWSRKKQLARKRF
ncbi:MAG: hypothetical protein JEZ12_00440 [Desulfobacterium sp.]|nr:hypothetical protein [Desulfobacterium sp.]